MKENISCEIVQDLLPNYIEDIVSNESKELVSEHLDKCSCCKKEWANMNTLINVAPVKERKIDYLKRIHKKSRNILLACIILSGITFLISVVSSEANYDEALLTLAFGFFAIILIIGLYGLPLFGAISTIFLYKKTKKKWLIFICVICTCLFFYTLVHVVKNKITYGF